MENGKVEVLKCDGFPPLNTQTHMRLHAHSLLYAKPNRITPQFQFDLSKRQEPTVREQKAARTRLHTQIVKQRFIALIIRKLHCTELVTWSKSALFSLGKKLHL